jgi:hypothetical protein
VCPLPCILYSVFDILYILNHAVHSFFTTYQPVPPYWDAFCDYSMDCLCDIILLRPFLFFLSPNLGRWSCSSWVGFGTAGTHLFIVKGPTFTSLLSQFRVWGIAVRSTECRVRIAKGKEKGEVGVKAVQARASKGSSIH